MTDCHRCGKTLKDLRRHMLRVHPEEYWLRPTDPPPHASAYKMTIESQRYTRDGFDVTDGEWRTERYGFRRHGWFVPVEVRDNLDEESDD